jgi:hypothetical protein
MLAVGHDLYVATPSKVVVLDARSGARYGALKTRGYTIGEDPQLAAAPGLLLVTGGGLLTAWESVFKPKPGGIATGATSFDVFAGKRFGFVGVLGSQMRGARPRVRVERARWPGKRFKSLGRAGRSSPDGFFGAGIRLSRNSRLRASLGKTRSRPLTVYVYPKVKLGRARWAVVNRVVQLRAAIRAPGTHLTGRTLVLYILRHGTKRVRRIDAARIRGGHATFRYGPFHSSRKDTLWYCVRGGLKLGFARPSPFSRRCGARVLPKPPR